MIPSGSVVVAMALLGATPLGTTTSTDEGTRVAVCEPRFGPVRDTGEVVLVGVPTEDTVEVATRDGTSFGQIVQPSRIAGFRHPDGPDSPVVLVPWGFDRQCRPIPWTGGWTWAEPGARSFFRGRLRPVDAWSEGRPTIDVFGAVWEGLPNSRWLPAAATGRELMSADELFDLYALLPPESEYHERPYGSVAPLVEWRRRNETRAAYYPASQILNAAFGKAEEARLSEVPLPYVGTYHVRLEIDRDSVADFYLRTGHVARPAPPDVPVSTVAPAAPEPATSLQLQVRVAGTMQAVAENDDLAPACSRSDGIRVAATPEREGGRHTWGAELVTGAVAACLSEPDVMSTLAVGPDDGTHFGGWFRREADGTYTFRQRVASSRGPALLTGYRIDLSTIPETDID